MVDLRLRLSSHLPILTQYKTKRLISYNQYTAHQCLTVVNTTFLNILYYALWYSVTAHCSSPQYCPFPKSLTGPNLTGDFFRACSFAQRELKLNLIPYLLQAIFNRISCIHETLGVHFILDLTLRLINCVVC